MRILFLSAAYLPTVNGVSYYQHHLAQALRKLGHEVYIFAPQHPAAAPDPFVIRYPALATAFARHYPVGFPSHFLNLLKSTSIDIVHIHHPFQIAHAALELKRSRRLPFVFTHHTQYHQYLTTYLPFFPQLSQALLHRHLQQVGKEASLIFCPTSAIYQELQAIGLPKLQHLPNGINLDQFTPKKTKSRRRLNLIYIGRLEKEKNPLPLIHLAAAINKTGQAFRLTLVGDGKLVPILQSQIQKHHLEAVVTLTGQLTPSQITPLLPKAHFFVSYSQTEVMPLTYLEAMAAGVPLLLPSRGVIKGLTKKENSLILPSDYATAAGLILAVFHQPEKYQALVKGALDTARAHDINRQAPQILQYYQQVLDL